MRETIVFFITFLAMAVYSAFLLAVSLGWISVGYWTGMLFAVKFQLPGESIWALGSAAVMGLALLGGGVIAFLTVKADTFDRMRRQRTPPKPARPVSGGPGGTPLPGSSRHG